MQGRMKEARELLRIHSANVPDTPNPYAMVEELLRTMPRMYAG